MPTLPVDPPTITTSASWLEPGALDGEGRLAGIELPVGVTLDDVALSASTEAWRRTGRIFGITVYTNARFSRGSGCGGCNRCEGVCSVNLGPHAVSVQAVKVDGVTLSSTAYALIGDELWRQDGYLWLGCQSATIPLGQPGTWSVDYTAGTSPPPDGIVAVRELAIYRALRLATKRSKVPGNTATASRQGATQTLSTPSTTPGRPPLTGVALFDDFVLGVNPHGLVRRSTVLSPDRMRRLR